ncbi:MAG: hypothetical protein US71_C0001G0065 [Parcubacteria group bacterium GW2011_GWD2_38_12]|uniref:Uncharacterized protein n=1 Tax=Candidatus Magasanikbacteria bacterium GW2011_GWE2_42_7 TaxID=1619052 RepID=A0A0G1BC02_9BACT|nr:MAG: hypothetical protein US06_C0001G0064 [Parcubacteria group bacterium GW2011_GWC2_36_17]KKQ52862.1 MAG: hypothetical protein US71_C0001G0065 [Parcubacteria group bacterium GW2011_GWD2_38_12]KKQ59065.1 MAG: hypothetical protein US79_C0001G0064 [Parcubacteria group bacterium GW2011_GWC1_38_17]KKQ59680.1 MAG: hypothetical protein US78_C0001G0040 [Parcubacteria group bacterium GW2011_GWD1_38_16]KKS70807.1 MAG: hypothetical protein UV42_C0043G0009 [Candidatus Magasanikbacteria bacterium GW2011
MKNIIIILIILVAAIGSGLFYWYEYRPNKIRSYCNDKAQDTLTGSLREFVAVQANYEDNYKKCLRGNGIRE